MSFEKLYYKGKEVKLEHNDTSETFYFEHVHSTTWDPNDEGVHACLDYGFWCWQHALEDPIKALGFIVWKVVEGSKKLLK